LHITLQISQNLSTKCAVTREQVANSIYYSMFCSTASRRNAGVVENLSHLEKSSRFHILIM